MQQVDTKDSPAQNQHQSANISPHFQYFEDENIDLYAMYLIIWRRKWVIITLTVVAAISSVFYALQLNYVYKAEALLLPPNTKDIQAMNVLGLQKTLAEEGRVPVSNSIYVSGITAIDVFKKFNQNLNSRSLHRKYIEEYGLLELLSPKQTEETRKEDIYKVFSEILSIEERNGISSIKIELEEPHTAAQWINDFVEFVDRETISMLVDNIENTIKNKIKDIEYTVGSKRELAIKRREDQIIRYIEASKIADSLGIVRRVDATNIIQNTQMNVGLETATTPLYYLGYEALMTEIEILRNRESDDPFIIGLRDLQEQLAMLKSVKLDEGKMHAVLIDQAAYPPKIPFRPNRKMIVSLSTVGGFFAGILLAFFIEYVQNIRRKNYE